MGTYKRFIIVFLIIVSLLVWSENTYATSWEVLTPEKVSERAEVIIIGSYNFSSHLKNGKDIYDGIEFHVKGVYKGETPEILLIGIDPNDIGWVEEVQNEGSEFLLFLEKGNDRFLTPVGGPNGMIQILKGRVHHMTIEHERFYETYLNKQSKAPLASEDDHQYKLSDYKGTITLISVIFASAVVLLLWYLFYMNKHKKHEQ